MLKCSCVNVFCWPPFEMAALAYEGSALGLGFAEFTGAGDFALDLNRFRGEKRVEEFSVDEIWEMVRLVGRIGGGVGGGEEANADGGEEGGTKAGLVFLRL